MLLVLLFALQPGLNSDYQRGVEFVKKGQLEAAVPFLVRAAQASPRDPQVWKALGVAYAAQQRYDLAEQPFRSACELDAGLEDACYYHARSLYALNRFEPSLELLRKLLATNPRSWKIHLGVAQALEALGRAEEAEQEFKKSVMLSQNKDPGPGIAFGLFLVRQGRFAQAIAPLNEVLKSFPEAPEAHVHLGRALLEEGKLADAIHHFERAVTIQPRSAQAHLLLGKAYMRAGRAAEAQSHFEAAARYETAQE